MLRTATAILGLLWGIGAVSAADMPIKAAPKRVNPFISYQGSGFYWFGGAFGGSTIVDAGVTHLNASGAGMSAGGGWMKGNGTTWFSADLRANYSTVSVDAVCAANVACALSQKVSGEARLKYGSDSTTLARWIPNLGLSGLFDVLPAIPDGVSMPSHPYVFGYGEVARNRVDIGVLDTKKWRTEIGAGVGMVHQIGATKAVDTWAKCGTDVGSAIAGVGATTVKLGATCKGGMDLIF